MEQIDRKLSTKRGCGILKGTDDKGRRERDRMRFKLIPIFLLAFIIGITAPYRAGAVTQGPNITVEEIYKNFRAVYLKFKNFQADFEETTYLGGKKSQAKGRLVFAKPNLLRKEYFDPKDPKKLAQLIVIDGKTAWSYTPWLGQVTRQDMKGEENRELLPGVGEGFEKLLERYEVKLVKDEVANAKGIYKVEVRAKNGEYLEIWIRGKDWIPVQIVYHGEGDKTVTIISFKNIKLDVKLPSDTFKFTPPEGVEVITISSGKG